MAQTQVVILDSSNIEDIFVCGICKAVFNAMELFLNHKQFQCMRRKAIYIDNKAQETGSKTLYHSNEKPMIGTRRNDISCSICKRKFKRLKCLYSHLKLHEKPSQCLICGRCFENTSHLKRHLSTHKVWPDGLNETTPKSSNADILSYSCSYCDAVLSNYSHFRAHLNNHIKLKKFKCIQAGCNSFFDAADDLLHHVSVYHITTKYTCHICKNDYPCLNEIAVHYKSHNESTEQTRVIQIHQYKCSKCDATFRKPEKLSLHLLTESHNKSCIHCKKAFASDKRLRMHLQIHKNSKPFQCDICNSSFHMKKYLTSHMLKHGDRQFVCMICKRSFKRRDVLQRHMRTHSKGKMLKCPFMDINNCNKEFSRRDKLKQHLKSHAKYVKPTIQNNSKPAANFNSGILELCIVPLDSGSLEHDMENDK